MTRIGLLVVLVTVVGGCASPEQRAERIHGECAGYGYPRGTRDHADCVRQKYAQLEAKQDAAIASAAESLKVMSQRPTIQPPPQTATYTTCQPNQFGGVDCKSRPGY